MVTQGDIEDNQPIDIRVKVVDELDRYSPKMATRLKVKDEAGNTFPFTVWNNNALSDYAWEKQRWYELENAIGNVYRGEKSLNGSSQLQASPVDEATEIKSTGQKPTNRELDTLPADRPYLSLFPIDSDFASLSVYEYRIDASGTFEKDPMQATYDLAAYLRKQEPAAVTHTGALTIVTTSPLTTSLPDVFSLTNERKNTLEAEDASDRATLERLLKQLLKQSIDAEAYHTDRIDRIRSQETVIDGNEGLFEACHAYALRLEILPSGEAFVGVELRHHTRSQATLDDYLKRTKTDIDSLAGTHVEHDPDRYAVSGSATVEGYAESHFTDPLPELGNQSLAAWYDGNDRVPDDLLEELRQANPRLVEISYSPTDSDTNVHVPQLLRVSPRKEVVKKLAPAFHRRLDRMAKLLPNDRFEKAREFVAELEALPEVDATVEPTPVGPSLEFQTTQVDRSDNLRFADGRTADVPSRGLNYGVNKRPESFHIQYLVPTRYGDEFGRFRTQLQETLAEIGCSPDETKYAEYALGDAIGYANAVASIDTDTVDAILAVVPPKDSQFIRDGTIDDPYPELKKACGKQSLPTQMVVADNLDNRWVHRNTALGLIGGAGGVPWTVDEMPGSVDCFIGLDATYDQDSGQFLGASANVVRADGIVFLSKTQSVQAGETFDEEAIVDVLKDVYREFIQRTEAPPEQVVVHRDGRLFENVDEILAPFENTAIDIDILDVRKSGAPRIAFRDDDAFRIDEKGRLFIAQNDDVGFLSTTGQPEFGEDDGLGTPQTLRIVRRAGDTDLQTLLEQVYWLSESHIGSAQRSTRLPITTYYADRCAEHARDGYLMQGELIRGVPYL
jgi:hypothetical protein